MLDNQASHVKSGFWREESKLNLTQKGWQYGPYVFIHFQLFGGYCSLCVHIDLQIVFPALTKIAL